jgi:hypothetical protein
VLQSGDRLLHSPVRRDGYQSFPFIIEGLLLSRNALRRELAANFLISHFRSGKIGTALWLPENERCVISAVPTRSLSLATRRNRLRRTFCCWRRKSPGDLTKIWISAFALSLLSLSVLAQTADQPTGKGQMKSACSADVQKFCADAPKGKGEVRAYLDSHQAELSRPQGSEGGALEEMTAASTQAACRFPSYDTPSREFAFESACLDICGIANHRDPACRRASFPLRRMIAGAGA